jgi:hypothetical protein
MATEVVHTVGSGGDYADLAAWSAAQARNLVSANEIAVAEIVGTLTEPSYVPISTSAGWSTDSTRRIVIRAAAPFNGTLGAGSKLVLGSSSPYGMAFSAALHVSIENLEVEYTGTSRAVNGSVLRISGCFIYGSSITDPNVLLLCDSAELNSSVFQSSARGYDARNVTATVDNCGFFALSGLSTYGLLTDSGTTVRNTVSAGWRDADIYGTPGTDSNNATLDGSVGATISTATGVDFVDYGSGDYRPTATGALFKAGTNPLSPLSNPDDWKDITGKTRAYWDIGAFAAPASLAENTHLATFTTRPTDTGASGGPNVAGTETNYPGYIDLSEAPQALWDAVTSGGGDIRVFENQAGGLVELPAEVVSCDTSAETGELHVLIPFLDSSADTVLSIYADGSSADYAVDDPFGRNAVWGDYAVVSHDGATNSTGNADGVLGLSAATSSTDSKLGTKSVLFGAASFNNRLTYSGSLISSSNATISLSLSANWITTEYNNQSDPSSFYTATDPSASSPGGDPCMRILLGGQWVKAVPYILDGGTWKIATPYTLTSGVWQAVGETT